MDKLHLEIPNLSFWLIPAKEERKMLQKIIDQLAQKYESISFCPHVTLFTIPTATAIDHYESITRSEVTSLSLMRWSTYIGPSITTISPFSLRIGNVLSGVPFAKTVFVQLEPTSSLLTYIAHLKQAMNVCSDHEDRIDPHVSLIYGAFTAEHKQAIARSIHIPQSTLHFEEIQVVQAPAQFETYTDVRSLKCIYAQSLIDA